MLTINNTLDGYLKDVEIKGNTIQDAENLADIRSVGDKVEGQELYEIPVLSCGKNLFDGELEKGGISSSTGELTNNDNIIRSKNYIRVNSGGALSFSSNHDKADIQYVVEYDINKNFLKYTTVFGKLTLSDQTKYIKFRSQTNGTNSYTLPNDYKTVKIQIEEGTVATPYEPYVEDKLTILSPVQLERVGDVADRIIEKDGVWGVEKNIKDFIIPGGLHWYEYTSNIPSGATGGYVIVDLSDFNIIVKEKDYHAISDKNIILKGSSVAPLSSIGIFLRPDTKNIYIKDYVSNLEEMKLKYEGSLIKYPTNTPTFIPLPHDQQIKLRTFANKTNISFLTEIEGTIKAQVPKSLGATVNTHTEQIRSLNNELNRVKKLEESTVSTVETESDFTTVEATSNGYFEDVKLEGKTLVNVLRIGGSWFEQETTLQTDSTTAVGLSYYSGTLDLSLFKNNTVYTIIPFVDYTVIKKGSLYLQLNTEINGTQNAIFNINEGMFNKPTLITTKELTNKNSNALFIGGANCEYKFKNVKILILEGDHTQNPPSYFEGLKSVGESATTSEDGADEIVVSSVKADGNLFDGTLSSWWIGSSVIKEESSKKYSTLSMISPNEVYTIKNHTREFNRTSYAWLDKDFNTISMHTFTSINECTTKISPNNSKYLLCYINSIGDLSNNDNITLNKGTTPKPYTPHKSDKKRLLYYNEETQAWEKPILREWDSIEKHADGKYYYHQRSGEVVFDGSDDEGWSVNNSLSSDNGKTFNSNKIIDTLVTGTTIADKFPSTSYADLAKKDYEFITNNTVNWFIKITPNKLITQDLAGFKQWLQANNVTVAYQLAQEKVYECTNIDLITYSGETNYIVESGAIAPKSTLKVHNNISNVVKILQEKVSLLEDTVTDYMITQNRLMLASRYNADTVSFKVDVATLRDTFEYDNDLYELILNNILVGKDNYNRDYIENLIIFYWMDFVISDEMYITLFEIIEEQHNPKVIEAPIE